MEQVHQNADQTSAAEIVHASDCALHNGPSMEPGPCDCGAQKAQVIQALEGARLALCASHNVLATDRPDLPRSSDTSWTTDHSKEIEAIGRALEAINHLH